MIIGGTPVPKRELIHIIRRVFNDDTIRGYFNIQSETLLEERLESFTKKDLLSLINTTQAGKAALEKTKAAYPLTTSPTLYLVHVNHWPQKEILKAKSDILATNQKQDGIPFGDEKTIRCIYMIASISEFRGGNKLFTEIPLVYEKAIEYRNSDQESENYGEIEEVISLEHGFIWYSEDFNHAILACNDYVAVKPILYFGQVKFSIEWQLPNLSEAMLLRLAQNADPRTASFAAFDDDPTDRFDVNSITVSDLRLGERNSFSDLRDSATRQQTSGFYVNHPGLNLGGLGITRRYGRIWTPAKIHKDHLLALVTTLINSAEDELEQEFSRSIYNFIDYYQNYPVEINGKKINEKRRKVFDAIIKAILISQNHQKHESALDVSVKDELIAEFNELNLFPVLICTCQNCGEYVKSCPICNSPLQPERIEGDWVFTCPSCEIDVIRDNTILNCDCGDEIDITFSSDIRIFPGASLLKAVYEFISLLDGRNFEDAFIINGEILRIVQLDKKKNELLEYQLQDFSKWSMGARINFQNPADSLKKEYCTTLGRIKEKCKRNNSHPTKEICAKCQQSMVTEKRIKEGEWMCLSRLFGIAIDEFFDGIHHGHEGMDLQYVDCDSDGNERKVGIHLKSRNYHKYRGIGRGDNKIKGLYAQYCYSIYQVVEGSLDEDVVGISIPNTIKQDVIESFRYMSQRFNIPIIILQEEDWIRILHIVLEKIELDSINKGENAISIT